jgi:L-asparaginase/Glu-tRNA(Gln) amidotransferase subunit D
VPRLDNPLREDLEIASKQHSAKILAMGGSIESVIDSHGIKTIGSEILQRKIESLEVEIPFEFEKICNIASHSLSKKEVILLAKSLNGVNESVIPVITAGTDCLEEVAFLASLLKPKSGAIVAATLRDGSQENVDSLISNIVKVLLNYSVSGITTPVVVDNLIFEASKFIEEMLFSIENCEEVREISQKREAFDYHDSSLLSELEKKAVLRNLEFEWPSVLVLNSILANYPKELEKTIENSDIVILQGFGAGNTNANVDDLLKDRLSKRKPVILLSAHPSIPLKPVSIAKGGNVNLLSSGIWNGQNLSIRKAALLASLLFNFENHGRAQFEKIANDLGSIGTSWG